MSDKLVDVLVVGAGPVGLFCANELTRHGLHARIIEKKTELSDKSKALGIHIRTLDVLEDCGFFDTFLQEGHQVRGALLKSKGKQLADLTFENIGGSRDYLIDLPQDKSERVFYQGLVNKQIPVEWQSELLRIEQQPDEVLATVKRSDGIEEKIRTKWIIACDGAHSTLRHLVNAEFIGSAYAQTWWLADLHIHWALPENKMIINTSEQGPLACFPMGNKRYRVVMTAPSEKTSQPTMDDIIEAFNKRSSDKAALSLPVWITAFSIHHRQIQQYRHERVFFSGDAAHVHSPMGGQGLNTGIQDVYNLVWKLALVQKGLAKDQLLNSYHEERYPIGKAVLKKTDLMTKMILIKNPYVIAARNRIITFLSSINFLRKTLARDLAELNISYAKSSIVTATGEKTGFKAGEFVPDIAFKNLATGSTKSLKTISQGTCHHLFLFVGKQNSDSRALSEIAITVANKYTQVLVVHLVLLEPAQKSVDFASLWIDENHVLAQHASLNHSAALLVRPDKYIGLVQSPVRLENLQSSLEERFFISKQP